MFERFTDRARQVMQLANQEALRFNHEYVGTEHILLGLVKEGTGVGANVLKNLSVDLRKIRDEVEKIVPAGPELVTTGKLPLRGGAKRIIESAIEEARGLNHNYVGTEHLLLGLLRERDSVAGQVLTNLNLELEEVRREVLNLLGHGMGAGGEQCDDPRSSRRKTPALDSFGTDLTEKARQGKLDPVIGRQSEIELVVQVLSRRSRNNPVLIGEAGVGKTALVHGLAQLIVDGKVPDPLHSRRVVFLDWGLLNSGIKHSGQLEERIKAVSFEVRRVKDVILYLDDLRAVACEDDSDAGPSNPLEVALIRGEIQCIVETTPEKYRRRAEKVSTLERCFQSVPISTPSKSETFDILRALRERYETHHRARITDEALEAAVELSSLYLPDEHFPLKAIDLIDQAGARVRLDTTTRPPDLRELDDQVERLDQQKEEAIANQDFERAASLYQQADALKKNKATINREWDERSKEIDGTVVEEVIEEIVSRGSGVSLEAVKRRDTSSLTRGMKFLRAGPTIFERLLADSILRGEGVEIQQSTSFVLMPQHEAFDRLFENVIRPAMTANGIIARKADNIDECGSSLSQVWAQICSAEVIVADVSSLGPTSEVSPNANVIFEVGLCLGLHRCPILLGRDPAMLPFNLRSLPYMLYEDSIEGAAQLKADLTGAIEEFLSASRESRAET